MKVNIYKNEEVQKSEAKKIINRLKEFNIIPKGCNVEFLIGSTNLWGLNPCFIGTNKEIIIFNNLSGNILAQKKIYPYSTITGYALEQTAIPRIFLTIGAASLIQIDTLFSAAGQSVIDFLESKVLLLRQ